MYSKICQYFATSIDPLSVPIPSLGDIYLYGGSDCDGSDCPLVLPQRAKGIKRVKSAMLKWDEPCHADGFRHLPKAASIKTVFFLGGRGRVFDAPVARSARRFVATQHRGIEDSAPATQKKHA